MNAFDIMTILVLGHVYVICGSWALKTIYQPLLQTFFLIEFFK